MIEHTVLGLMSGSSLDGLDIACVRFWGSKAKLNWALSAPPITIPYPENIQTFLNQVHNLEADALAQLHTDLGSFYGTIVQEYVLEKKLTVDLVASHGHTVRHHPDKGYSLQIGDGDLMALHSRLPCVTQFRSEDIVQGGQGAPLAPVVEHYLFGDYKMFLNLGGICNVSLHGVDQIIGYDVCPANQLLNHLSLQLGQPFDDRGAIAQSAEVDAMLLAALHQDEYHGLPYPKSLDNNYIREQFIQKLDQCNIPIASRLATCTLYIAQCLGNEIKALAKSGQINKIFVSGGGAYNDYLLTLLQAEIGDIQLVVPDDEIIQHKESILMALCGYLYLNKLPNSFAAATGARMDTINGVWHSPHSQM